MADQPFSRKNLVEIGEELGKVDVESLKFLCKDVLPRRSIQKMDRATQIFISLLEKGKLKPDDGDFLLQCLYYMKKHNIIKKLGYRCEDIEKNIKEKKYKVTPYRAMLFELSEDLDTDEIETIKFSIKEKYSMKKNQMDRLRSGLNIMDTLETDGHIDETNVKDLENFILQVLGRDDLKKYFDEYFASSSQAPRVPIGHTNVDVSMLTVPSGTQQDSVETDIKIDESQTPTPPIPGEPDFLLGFACVPGYVSYRRRSTGSIYIEKLTNAIDRFADRCDLSTILLQVNHDVSDEKLEIPVEISAQGSIAGQQPSQQVNRFIACSAPLNALRRQLFL
ncbi:hypothetical protein KUTeg_001665 [Tegillarca granosa]|uniref:Caspase-8 n=1 Tax=Tegillarca granosa TaxID=220873 RepID=A0ABQ9FS40_TEGGR|nr:hypothetical protein KUTeg_001665 [Tegillarca granosa]